MNELEYEHKVLRIDGKYNNKRFKICIETQSKEFNSDTWSAVVYWMPTKLTNKEKYKVVTLIARKEGINIKRYLLGNPASFYFLDSPVILKRTLKPLLRRNNMKYKACHKHFKPERTIEQDSVYPDCQPAGNTQLNALFEEILKRHVALTELKEIYRHKLAVLLQDKNLDK